MLFAVEPLKACRPSSGRRQWMPSVLSAYAQNSGCTSGWLRSASRRGLISYALKYIR
jgi:hypothetical protein